MAKVAELAKITAKPGMRDALLDALRPMTEQSQREPGTEFHVFHVAADDEVTVWTYELYTDQDARDVHGASPAMAEIGGKVGPLLASAPELIRLVPAFGKGPGISPPA